MTRLVEAPVIADMLGVPPSWVYEHARSGAIPHVKLGHYVRFEPDAVVAWVESLRTGGTQSPRFRRHHPVVAVSGQE